MAPDKIVKDSMDTIMAVFNNVTNLNLPDQLILIKMVYDMGIECDKIAKRNKINVISSDSDSDFTKFPNMRWSIVDEKKNDN